MLLSRPLHSVCKGLMGLCCDQPSFPLLNVCTIEFPAKFVFCSAWVLAISCGQYTLITAFSFLRQTRKKPSFDSCTSVIASITVSVLVWLQGVGSLLRSVCALTGCHVQGISGLFNRHSYCKRRLTGFESVVVCPVVFGAGLFCVFTFSQPNDKVDGIRVTRCIASTILPKDQARDEIEM